MQELIEANLDTLIEQGVPEDLAYQALEILAAQNRGELPCPLEGEELEIVQEVWCYVAEAL